MFQARFGKVDEFCWWDMDRIQTDTSTQFTSKEFQEGLSVSVLRLELLVPNDQERNFQVELIW